VKISSTEIEGLYLIQPQILTDLRGYFLKTFHEKTFVELGLNTKWKEEYFSESQKGIIRGMHFQTPPHEHFKLVTCLRGKVLDVICDLRRESETFKKVISFELSALNSRQLYIPKGCAHGFLALDDNSLMFYKVSTVYNPTHDSGILWSSINFEWPRMNYIISDRDSKLQSLETFKSPF
jgi:dTDP-4-dehydrorhamnose 3,5-epimerase